MKLLIVTQSIDVNNPILGFFGRWVQEFAKHFESITVVCLFKGEYDLSPNVKVLSLGKEEGGSRIHKTLRYIVRFYGYIWRERKNYDAVFVHMNPVYVVLGAPLWRIWKKRVALWYTHRNIDWTLRVAEKCADDIFTATAASFRIKSPKLKILGHGVFTRDFARPKEFMNTAQDKMIIISVGRITPIKNLDVLIKAVAMLRDEGVSCEVLLIGGTAVSSDRSYLEYLQKLVKEKNLEDIVRFVGSVPNKEVTHYCWKSDISVNLAPTGGIDKAVLESMASGVPVIVANKAFEEYFGKYADDLMFKEGDAMELHTKIRALFQRKDKAEVAQFLTRVVEEKGSAKILIERIVKNIS